jgi:RNA polymerase sigma-70 factor (ECF subfamily)
MGEALQEIEAEIPRLRRYARYPGHDPDHADDLVRGCLVRAVAENRTAIVSTHTGPPDNSLRRWLFAILRSCHIDETRTGQCLDASASTRGEAASPANRVIQEADAALSELRDAYLSLSVESREVLLLVVIEGLQQEEVVTILGVPLCTVRSRLSQARQALRQALEAGRSALASRPALRMSGISP